MSFAKLAANSGYVPNSAVFEGELTGTIRRQGSVCWLSGRKNGKIRITLPDGTGIPEGSVRVSGKLSADKANKEYPYQMAADKIEVLKKD